MANAVPAPTPGPTPARTKLCVYCGEDCSQKPRQRDPEGRYACNECVERARTEQAMSVQSATADMDVPAGVSLTPAEVAALEANTIPIAPVVAPPPRVPPRELPPALATCPKCGYVLGGLKVPRCPECGTTVTKESVREMRLEEDRAATARAFWLKPMLMLTIGVGIMCAISIADGGGTALALYGVKFVANLAVGVLVFWICSHIWIGFDEPFRWVAFRIAGIYAVMDVLWYLRGLLPIPFIFPALVLLAIYVHLLMSELDIDLQDAILVGIVTFVAKLMLVFAMVAWFASLR